MEVKQSFSKITYSSLKEKVMDVLTLIRKRNFPLFQDTFKSTYDNVWLLFALIIGIGIRGYYLSQPMQYDESYTFLYFVNGNPLKVFYYHVPNNHVLHTLLVKLITLIVGANPISIRLVAVCAGIGCIPLIFSLSRQLKQSGVFAALTISVFPFLISYSTNARGYTLLVLLTLILASICLQTLKKPSVEGAFLIAFVASLGMLTIPTMLFPIAGLYTWLAIMLFTSRQDFKIVFYKFIIPLSFFTVIFTLFFYTPVFIVTLIKSHNIDPIINNKFVRPQPWTEFLAHLYPHITSTLDNIFRDIPWFLLLFSAMLALIGILSYIKKRDYPSLLLLPSILVGSIVILL